MTQVGRGKNTPYSIERSRPPLLNEPRQVLNEQERAIYELYYEKGMTQREIADSLGVLFFRDGELLETSCGK